VPIRGQIFESKMVAHYVQFRALVRTYLKSKLFSLISNRQITKLITYRSRSFETSPSCLLIFHTQQGNDAPYQWR